MHRIYLSGPMTDMPDFNYPAFNAEAARLRALGYDVVNPAENPPQASWAEYMRYDIPLLLTCDTLALLPGWHTSKGARMEHYIAAGLGMFKVSSAEVLKPSTAHTKSPDAAVNGEFGDAYQGAREDLAIWKRRALDAEQALREEVAISGRLVDALNEESGPTFMGEPLVSDKTEAVALLAEAVEVLREVIDAAEAGETLGSETTWRTERVLKGRRIYVDDRAIATAKDFNLPAAQVERPSEFRRENRYIVIKRSDLKNVPVNYRAALVEPMLSLLSHLPRREYVVVESDWPEYQATWEAIERRVQATSQANATAKAGE